MEHVSLMRDFFVSDKRKDGRTDKPILGVGRRDHEEVVGDPLQKAGGFMVLMMILWGL